MAAVGCGRTGSGVAGASDAESDAPPGPARVIGGGTLSGATECAAAGGQCEVGAVCGLQQALNSGPCGPEGSVCCLHVLCAADATVQLIQASDYDQSCVLDSDCAEVFVGNACTCELSCEGTPAAINKDALSQYTADVGNAPKVFCGCPLRVPGDPVAAACCVGGTCQFTSGCAGPAPGVDASASEAGEAGAGGFPGCRLDPSLDDAGPGVRACTVGKALVQCTDDAGAGCECVSDDPTRCAFDDDADSCGPANGWTCQNLCGPDEYAVHCGGVPPPPPPPSADGSSEEPPATVFQMPPAACKQTGVILTEGELLCCPCE
jgi:hypothetical protein